MRVISWNVNGLRAAISKGAIDKLLQLEADVLCLQEIKAKPEQLTEQQIGIFGEYQTIWNPAERPGYSGVATFTRKPPDLIEISMGEERFDIEGRFIRADYGEKVICNLYVPNGKRDLGRLDYKLDFYAKMLQVCDQLHEQGKKVIICGDINTAHKPIDLTNPKQNEKYSGFLPEERAWIDKFLQHGFVDIYRQMHGERVQYTWWTYRMNARARNIGWRLDYFLVSRELIDEIENVEIYDQLMGSDHCPIGLDIRT